MRMMVLSLSETQCDIGWKTVSQNREYFGFHWFSRGLETGLSKAGRCGYDSVRNFAAKRLTGGEEFWEKFRERAVSGSKSQIPGFALLAVVVRTGRRRRGEEPVGAFR